MSSITQSLRRKRCFGTLCPAATPIYRMKLIPNGLVKGDTYFAFFHFEYAHRVTGQSQKQNLSYEVSCTKTLGPKVMFCSFSMSVALQQANAHSSTSTTDLNLR